MSIQKIENYIFENYDIISAGFSFKFHMDIFYVVQKWNWNTETFM